MGAESDATSVNTPPFEMTVVLTPESSSKEEESNLFCYSLEGGSNND